MRMIFCNIQLFSNDQMIQVIDDEGGLIHYRKVDIDDLTQMLCVMSGEFDVDNIKISGSGSVYAEAWAEEIRNALKMNYSNRNIIVEVV